MPKQTIKTSGFSLAKGRQLTGDDFFEVKTIDTLTIAVVCDGVGSAMEGAEAAKRVTHYLITNFKNRPTTWSIQKSIETFITSINAILYEESMANYERPELVTTLTLVIIEGNRLYGANVGDSRIYLQREGNLTQLSHDHAMEEEGYEGVLTQAIGIDKSVSGYYFENSITPKDRILLCSDGLYTLCSTQQLQEGIGLGAHALVKQASRREKEDLPDDTTAVVIDILGVDKVAQLKEQNLIIPTTLSEGMVIDGYRLKRSLIQNNRTWLCEKKSQEYVLKFAPQEARENPQLLDLYVKEAWNAKRLKAGFFPKASIPKNRTHRYYMMRVVEGVDLKTHLKKRHLSVEDTLHLAKMLLKMGQFLLKYDLVHGDIKPENIMIYERDGKAIFKMIDFGSMRELYSTNSKAGTPSYLSPERFRGVSISESSEIFAIGVTLYEALTQHFPYEEIEPFQTPTFKSPTTPDRHNRTIPDWLNSILLRAIEREADLRYQNYSEMLFELNTPTQVKPYFDKEKTLIERNPLMVYRVGFIIEFMIIVVLLFVVLEG